MSPVRHFLFALCITAVPVQLAAAPAQAVARDWSKVAVRTPAGAFVQGNPDARVKLVEYLSLTCPHCAHFEGEGIAPLTAKYIRTGLVSYEVRHALRDGFDIAGSILARCDGPEAFFTTLPKVFAQQDVWFARAQAWSQIEQASGTEAPDQLLPKLAAGAGFDRVFGMTSARINACLTNHAEQDLLKNMAAAAWRTPNFPGTPAFQIDGRLLEAQTWVDLDAKLAAALKTKSPVRKTKRS